MTVTTIESLSQASVSKNEVQLPPTLVATLRLLAVTGVVLMVLGSFAAPDRLWPSVLILGYYIFGIGIGSLYFQAMHHGSNGGWASAFKRVPEALLLLVPAGGGLIAAALVGDFVQGLVSVDAQRLYPWMMTGEMLAEEGHAGASVQSFKDVWLQPTFFYFRTVMILLGTSCFAYLMRKSSLAQDVDGEVSHTVATRRLSILFLVFGTLLLAMASIDWFMSLEPAWYSTMYIVYHWAGNFVTGLAVVVLVVLGLKGLGLMPGFSSITFTTSASWSLRCPLSGCTSGSASSCSSGTPTFRKRPSTSPTVSAKDAPRFWSPYRS